MDQESNQMEQGPVQCRNGCGFYAGSGTDGLCSVCYKDMIKKKQQPPQGMPASLAPSEPRSTSGPATMASLSIDETSSPKTSSTAAVETASPTVIVPSSLQTEKVLIFHSQVLLRRSSTSLFTSNQKNRAEPIFYF